MTSPTSMPLAAEIRIGCAGWSISDAFAAEFPRKGSVLERYATRFDATEVNTSFHRSHRTSTYARWASSVPDGFRFSVKLPRTITHDRKLVDCETLLAEFLDEVVGLGDKLGCLLVQLPPSLGFDSAIADAFFALLRASYRGSVVVEPRHPAWFSVAAEALLQAHAVGRVIADPAKPEAAAEAGGDPGIAYFRLHGTPRMYYSNYDDARLRHFATAVAAAAARSAVVWCVFDNTALGAATGNAMALRALVEAAR